MVKRIIARGSVLLGLASAAAVALLITGPQGILMLMVSLGTGLCIGRLIETRIGGLTGDNHGAVCEISQLAVLVLAPMILS